MLHINLFHHLTSQAHDYQLLSKNIVYKKKKTKIKRSPLNILLAPVALRGYRVIKR